MKRKSVKSRQKKGSSFDDEWIMKIRDGIEKVEKLSLDKPERIFSNSIRLSKCLECLAVIALEHTNKKEQEIILDEVESVCTRFGITVKQHGGPIVTCLAKNHVECYGRYENPITQETIECECKCHKSRK